MSRLPTVTARELGARWNVRDFSKDISAEPTFTYFMRGSQKWVTVPMNRGDVKPPLVKAILKQADLSEDQFRELL